MNDVFIYLPQVQSNASAQLYDMGKTAFAYISLHPDAFRLDSANGSVPRVAQTLQLDVWSYVGNSTSSELNDVSHV